MNREILFRGKKVNKDKWIYGVPVKGTPDDESEMLIVESVFNCDEYCCRGCNFDPVIPETVGQFTGLTDKNGKKIFEGDIVTGRFLHERAINSVIAFRNGAYGLLWNRAGAETFDAFTSLCNIEYEVIGNIHDNPELLGVSQ